jgi:hypothetical protein
MRPCAKPAKNDLKPHLNEQWCLAPTADPEFVWHMEDVLAVYQRPYDPVRPVVCLDETSRQLLGDVRPSQLAVPGHPARHDPEYVRGGVINLFLALEPLQGQRHVMLSEQRTRLDVAQCIKDLVDSQYPDVERIVLVLDQLNTHTPASLDAAFEPAAARRLTGKREIHDTPKHGSWLNMAELDLSAVQRQCLRQRLDWHFTTADARTKLRRLYPAYEA